MQVFRVPILSSSTKKGICLHFLCFIRDHEKLAEKAMWIADWFKIFVHAISMRRIPKRYLMRSTCMLLLCKHGNKQPLSAQDALCGWIFFFPSILFIFDFLIWDLFYALEWRLAIEGSRAHVLEVTLDEKTCLSFLSQVVTLIVLTLSNRLKEADIISWDSESLWILSVYAVKVRAFETSLTFSFFLHWCVRSPARQRHISMCICECGWECVRACTHARAMITTLFSMSDKSMKNDIEQKNKTREGGASPSTVVASVS